MTKKYLLFCTTLLLLSNAWATFYLEPYLGYEFSNDSQDATVSGNLTTSKTIDTHSTFGESTDGLALGLKAGYQLDKLSSFWKHFYFFGDLYYSKTDSTTCPCHATDYLVQYDSDKTFLSANIGFNMQDKPYLPNLWAGYILSANNTMSAYGQEAKYKGSGYHLGITFGKKLRFNLMYFNVIFDQRDGMDLPANYQLHDGEVNLTVNENKMESSGVVLFLSYPFAFK